VRVTEDLGGDRIGRPHCLSLLLSSSSILISRD